MNKILIPLFLVASLFMLSSCDDEVVRPDEWPEWPSKTVVKINGVELNDTYYNTFSGAKISLTEGQSIEFTVLTSSSTHSKAIFGNFRFPIRQCLKAGVVNTM